MHGFVYNSLEFKIILYYLLLFILEPQFCIPVLMNMLTTFGDLPGYSINWSKTELTPLGDNVFAQGHFQNCPDVIKYLEILSDISYMIKLNFNKLIVDIS